MTAQISDLQAKFIDFAKGMPAIAISWKQIRHDVELLVKALAGVNPDKPAALLANIPLPVFNLGYSVFIEDLLLKSTSNGVQLFAKFVANIHPAGHPEQVIRWYAIETSPTAPISLEFDQDANEVYWQAQGSAIPSIDPDWGPDADAVLATIDLPDPKRDSYISEVERMIIWLTGPSFIKLIASALPRYRLAELAPWLRFRPPLRVEASSTHVVITAVRATLTVGDCTPQTIDIEPDLDFPYGEVIPEPTLKSNEVDFAVYSPKTRLLDYFSKTLEPAIMVSDSGGGLIKWKLAGSVGLKSITVDLLTTQGLSGVISIAARLDFLAAARAWINGPCGTELSLANASLMAKGDFGADLILSVDAGAGTLEVAVSVTKSELKDPDWQINTPLPWPLDSIAEVIVEHVTKVEVRKLARKVSQIGKWRVMGMPFDYVDTARGEKAVALAEGLAGVSAFIAVKRWRQ